MKHITGTATVIIFPQTAFRRIRNIALKSGSHRRSGSESLKRYIIHDGIDRMSMIIDSTVQMAIANNAFFNPVIVAIDEHDGSPCSI